MFAGLRSRWTMPCSCANSSASAIWRAIASASSSGSGPCAMRSARVGPSTSSRTSTASADATLLDAVNGGDVGMVERGKQLRLAREARQAVGIGGDGRRQQLERDVALQPSIARAVDLAHAAAAQRRDDLVRADPGAGRGQVRVSLTHPHLAMVRATSCGAAGVRPSREDRGREPRA